MYSHQTLQVNYTTYDMRRDQDTISVSRHPDVMVLAPEEPDVPESEKHSYWYARVLGIYHILVRLSDAPDSGYQKMEFLWVRWFGRESVELGGFKKRRLRRIGFVDCGDPGEFGFLDPSLVIRAVHLIPAFKCGKSDDALPGPSIARSFKKPEPGEEQRWRRSKDVDWNVFYVNM